MAQGEENHSCELGTLDDEKLSNLLRCVVTENTNSYYSKADLIEVRTDEEKCMNIQCSNEHCHTFYQIPYGYFSTQCGNNNQFIYSLCHKNHGTETKNKSKKLKLAGLIVLSLSLCFILVVISFCCYRRYRSTANSNMVS